MIFEFLQTFDTGAGYWNPLVWALSFIIILLIAVIIRGVGNRAYKKQTGQTKVFLSGNEEYEKEQMHVKSSNLYWGWTESMQWFLIVLKKMHTGNVSDYVLWFVVIMGILFLAEGLM
jgi:hypothetical protein